MQRPGASTSWHDLVLYVISRHAGPTAAQAVARFFAMQWHADGLAPYVVFEPASDHGDSTVAFSSSLPGRRKRWNSSVFDRHGAQGLARVFDRDAHASPRGPGCRY